jgi:hypothetical protein
MATEVAESARDRIVVETLIERRRQARRLHPQFG